MKNFILFAILIFNVLLAGTNICSAQNAPITTAATVGGAVAGNVDVPLTVTGFNNIGAISLAIDYNYAVLNFTGATPHANLQGFPAGDLNLNNGYHRITMGWFAGAGVTLPDGSTIMTLHFTYISGISTLNWYDSGPSCEYADANYNVLNDIPTSTYYINGFVCGLVGNPGSIAGMTELCAGQTGIAYSIAPVENATGYVWEVPTGAVIVTGQSTNAITVDYPPNAVSGNVSVYGTNDCGSGSAGQLPVTVDELPVANAGADFAIPYGTSTTLHAAPGGSGTYAYHWSPEALLVNPDMQDPQTVVMTYSAVFTLLVTNQSTLCQSSDEVLVTITGGPLSVNPQAFPSILCQGGSSQLYSNASGGSGNYTYFWTSDPPGTPPWTSNLPNPVVTPDSSTHYLLAVNDGFTNASGSTNVLVRETPTATISGGDTLCGEDEVANLQVNLTGTPPWNFTYSYGSTSVFVNGQPTSPCNIIASETGDYTVTAVEDANCTGTSSGVAIVRQYPIPDTPLITVYFMELISSSCCGNQWYKNDTLIPGATGQTYEVLVSGQYTVIVTSNSCSSLPSEPVDVIVGIDENNPGEMFNFSSYPNPFSKFTTISYNLPFAGNVVLEINNVFGKHVAALLAEAQTAGNHLVKFNTFDLPAGVYIATLRLKSASDETIRTIKLVNNK